VDCHNPHGGVIARGMPQTVNANEPGCFRCHADKRGPFVFEHAPIKTAACSTCHEPHGSANPRMLNRAQVRFVCLECHSMLAGSAAAANSTLGLVMALPQSRFSPRTGTKIDVILLDMTMPGATSGEIIAQAANARPGIQVILTSAHSQETIAGGLKRTQIHSFIRKPFRLADLLKALRSCLSS